MQSATHDPSLQLSTANPDDASRAADQLAVCLEAIAQWMRIMRCNRLKVNPAKTDLIWFTTRRRQQQLVRHPLTFGKATICPSTTVHDLGVILDSELSFGPRSLVGRCFFQLHHIKSCVTALPSDAAKAMVNSFVVSRIDYRNCLLIGAMQYQLDRLQAVLPPLAFCLELGSSTGFAILSVTAFIGFLFHVAFSSKSVC